MLTNQKWQCRFLVPSLLTSVERAYHSNCCLDGKVRWAFFLLKKEQKDNVFKDSHPKKNITLYKKKGKLYLKFCLLMPGKKNYKTETSTGFQITKTHPMRNGL
jgi:hypothetical protein